MPAGVEGGLMLSRMSEAGGSSGRWRRHRSGSTVMLPPVLVSDISVGQRLRCCCRVERRAALALVSTSALPWGQQFCARRC